MASGEPGCSPTACGIRTRSYGRWRRTFIESGTCHRGLRKPSTRPRRTGARAALILRPTLIVSCSTGLLLELRVDLDLVARDHFVGLVGHAYNRHQFFEHGVSHSLFLRGHRVGGDEIVALVRHADRDVD